jgi:hypothetical protein
MRIFRAVCFVAAGLLVLASTAGVAAASVTRAAAPTGAIGPTTSLTMTSKAGDYIGGGESYHLTSGDGSLSFSGTPSDVGVAFSTPDFSEWWHVELAAPIDTTLSPGTYPNAERAPFRTGRAPGLEVYGDGRGCNTLFGSFTINQIGFDAGGNLNLLDASFVQHCESSKAPALTGTLLYNATPLSFKLDGATGDYVAGGIHKTYLNSTSIISVSGDASGVHVAVSGLRDEWWVDLAPPQGQSLHAGTYLNATRYPFEAPSAPGLAVYGDGRGCDNDYGTFTINAIRFDAGGNVTELSATLVQHCEGPTAPALKAVIHYFA